MGEKIRITTSNLPIKDKDKLMGEGSFEITIASPDSVQTQPITHGQISAERLRRVLA